MFFSTVLCALIVLHSTTASAQWKSCFDDSCPIKNLASSSKVSSKDEKGLSNSSITHYEYPNDNMISFTVGYSESGNIARSMEIVFNEKTLYVLYTCGPVARKSLRSYIYPEINGTTIYINGKEYCFWSMGINNSSFPFELIDPPQYYISETGYQIYYSLNQTVPAAPASYRQLPKSVESFVEGYQYKAAGSEKYLLIAREANKTTDFLLKVNGETPRLVEVKLKSDISINVECDLKKRFIAAYAKIDGVKNNLWNKIREAKINESECRWSLPNSFDTLYGPVKLNETAYELQIIENNMFVHFDDNFRIATSTSASH